MKVRDILIEAEMQKVGEGDDYTDVRLTVGDQVVATARMQLVDGEYVTNKFKLVSEEKFKDAFEDEFLENGV